MFLAKLTTCLGVCALVIASSAAHVSSADPPPPRLQVLDPEGVQEVDAATAKRARELDAAAQRFEAVTGINLEANETNHLVIVDVRADSHAASAALQVGDVVVQVDDHVVTNDKAFAEYLRQQPAKSAYVLQLLRNGKRVQVIVGIHVETLGMSVMMDEARRPLVQRVVPASPAEDGGILARDVVVAVNDQPTTDFERFKLALVSALKKSRSGDAIRFELVRDGDTRAASVVVPRDLEIPALDPKPKLSVNRLDMHRRDSVTAALFSSGPFFDSNVRVDAGYVGAVGVVTLHPSREIKDSPGMSTLDVTVQNMPPGTYTLVAHRYGDLRKLTEGSSGLVNVVIDTIVIDQSGMAKVEGKPVDVRVDDLAGHTAALLKVDSETLKFDASDAPAQYEFNAFGVFGWAQPPKADARVNQ